MRTTLLDLLAWLTVASAAAGALALGVAVSRPMEGAPAGPLAANSQHHGAGTSGTASAAAPLGGVRSPHAAADIGTSLSASLGSGTAVAVRGR